MSTRLPIIYGAGLFGARGTNANINDLAQAQRLLDVCIQYGVQGIDTSRIYGIGTSEEYLSKLDIKGARVDTKIFPRKPGDHAPERLKELVHESIKALNGIKIRVLYLHAPDRSVPYEDTVKALDELHKEGLFEHFGLSNYLSFEVAEIATICRLKGYVMPTVYQGVYNYLDRTAEPELFPCLRKYGISFAAYSPLAGGFLTGIHLVKDGIRMGAIGIRRREVSAIITPFAMGMRYLHCEKSRLWRTNWGLRSMKSPLDG